MKLRYLATSIGLPKYPPLANMVWIYQGLKTLIFAKAQQIVQVPTASLRLEVPYT